MILFVENHNGERQFWKINDIEDLSPVFAIYPNTHEIAMNSETLKQACASIAEYLSGHAMSSWVEDNEISKSLRNKAAALAIGLGAMTSSGIDNGTIQKLPHAGVKPAMQATQPEEAKEPSDFGSHPHDGFLWNIKQIESSGGKNTNHKPIASGKFKGMKAMGGWGLLKPTVNELVNRMRLKGDVPPEYAKLPSMSRDQLNEHLQQNPHIELNLARQLAEHVMKRQGGNKQRAAYAWLHGHNLHPADIPAEKLISSQYVNKYKAVDVLNPFNPRKTAALEKTQQPIDDADFKMRVKNWFQRRADYLTEEPTRSSNFQPDPGRMRDSDLDQVKPDSMKSSMEKLTERTKQANKD